MTRSITNADAPALLRIMLDMAADRAEAERHIADLTREVEILATINDGRREGLTEPEALARALDEIEIRLMGDSKTTLKSRKGARRGK